MIPLLVVGAGAGTVIAVAVATALGLPAGDTALLLAYAGGGAVLAGLAGAGVLHGLRRRSLGAQSAVVAVVAVASTGVGVLAAARAMFLSAHDLDALAVILVASASVGVVAGLALGRRVSRAGRALEDMAGRLADGGTPRLEPTPMSEELARLGRRLEETSRRLEASRRRERALESSRRELVAWVSHDLRTPLAGIRAMVEALEDGVVDDPGTVARYHRTMRQEADRLAGLVDDLFELSRIQAGALELAVEPTSLAGLVADALAAASVSADAKRVRLHGSLPEPAPLVEVATPEMARVVRNLLDNAIRHTPPEGEILVEAGLDGGEAFVAVTDGCGGIADHDLPRVFDLAFRGDPARTPGEGAGLGLAVARGLVEAHHGEIDVRNEDRGCRFTVRVPLRQP